MTEERNQRIAAENREKDQNKRMQRQIRDMKEETSELSKKEAEASRKKHELVRPWLLLDLIGFTIVNTDCNHVSVSPSIQQEMDIESLEAANQSLQVDLKLAFKRIADLQAAIEDEMESDDNDDLINRYSFNTKEVTKYFLSRDLQGKRKYVNAIEHVGLRSQFMGTLKGTQLSLMLLISVVFML